MLTLKIAEFTDSVLEDGQRAAVVRLIAKHQQGELRLLGGSCGLIFEQFKLGSVLKVGVSVMAEHSL